MFHSCRVRKRSSFHLSSSSTLHREEIRKCITCTDQIGPSHPFTQTTHSYAHLIWSITSHQFWHLDSWGLDIGPLGSSMMWRRRQSTSLNFISHRRIKLQVSLPVRAVSYWEDWVWEGSLLLGQNEPLNYMFINPKNCLQILNTKISHTFQWRRCDPQNFSALPCITGHLFLRREP